MVLQAVKLYENKVILQEKDTGFCVTFVSEPDDAADDELN